jgi:hypothetical protein
MDDDGEAFTVSFDSAWSPPSPWLEYIAPQFPDLNFKLTYQESGMGYCGIATWDSENVFDSEDGELQFTDYDGNPVEYDGDADKWKNIETGEYIDEDYFSPMEYNQYEEL